MATDGHAMTCLPVCPPAHHLRMTANGADEQSELHDCYHPSPGLLARAAAGWARFLRSAPEQREPDDE
ncbi:hypothetical protein GCM10010302_70610 [Streptomyces polychromogenes]|uniref:Uncharacterized protein n=1 Tax=Streptomyces polychromogenes TaxID=67342 RepID=A0ABN0VZR5_9ACTN